MMKIKQTKRKPTAILTADWHQRADIPKARTDKVDYLSTQATKREAIFNMANQFGCPILIAGDLGHKPEWPCWLLSSFINSHRQTHSPQIFVTPGQHDLPHHLLSEWYNSGLGLLSTVGCIVTTVGPWASFVYDDVQVVTAPYGQDVPEFDGTDVSRRVLMMHRLVSPTYNDPNGGHYYKDILEAYSEEFDLIVTGDNHKTFVVRTDKTTLVNPGSIMRMASDQADHVPCVFLWYAEDNSVQAVKLPAPEGVVSRDHIEEAEYKGIRKSAFIERLGSVGGEVSESFGTNVERLKQGATAGAKRKVDKACGE